MLWQKLFARALIRRSQTSIRLRGSQGRNADVEILHKVSMSRFLSFRRYFVSSSSGCAEVRFHSEAGTKHYTKLE
jgi:hypothetical protein